MESHAGPAVYPAGLGNGQPRWLAWYVREDAAQRGQSGLARPLTAYTEPVVLSGRYIRLEPLEARHAADLAAVAMDEEIWRWMPFRTPGSRAEVDSQVAAAQAEWAQGMRVPFAVMELDTGLAIGSTSFLDIAPEHRRIEIGSTWLARRAWRTVVNTESKLLLLGHAFETLDVRRVSIKTDHLNLRSQRAIERLGAVREGVLRSHYVRPDGSRRDTVYYSVLDEEWPRVRQRLLTFLAQSPAP